ncbi:Uncharacterised protein [Moraxella lacunata]|uniref:Uncharacterized protein n=1 Tax=Moraxella lacunata TaxID=477 RepID=A0A378TTG2_MORLA|nr:hypothetical protein [Moraxella lacunata]STZ64046.1 Uncharacterised protein [Moraxella lacunata]
MSNEVVLCILEGKKPDKAIFNQLKSIFFKDRNVDFFYIGISIYGLYNKILSYKNDIDFIDIFPIIKQIIVEQHNEKEFGEFDEFLKLKQNNISEIFLFFDYDGQDKNNSIKNPETIDAMLEFFNNETEFGKLYINYPMVESYKHRIDNKIEVITINNNMHYKTFVASICDKKLEQIGKLNRNDWISLFLPHLKSTNHLFLNEFSLPQTYQDAQQISQLTIYQQQKQKYIEPNQQIMVLNSFAWFLLEYLGEKLFNEFQVIDNQEKSQ